MKRFHGKWAIVMTVAKMPSSSSSSSSLQHFCWLFSLLIFMPQICRSVRLDENSNRIFPLHVQNVKSHSNKHLRIFYQSGNSEKDLPFCSPNSVCNKIDTYGTPWVEKQCKCGTGMSKCSMLTNHRDGHTIVDRTKLYKTCEPVRKLPRCKYFKDVTWSLIAYPDNSTQQVMHCKCPKNSVAYLIKRQAFEGKDGTGFQYSFACSPQTKIKCQRKQPCRLFSVRKDKKRPPKDEVNMSTLCQCPHKKRCPKHHLDVGVIPGKTYSEESVRTYSGYCM